MLRFIKENIVEVDGYMQLRDDAVEILNEVGLDWFIGRVE